MSERAVPWRAIPQEANRYMLLSVVFVLERRLGEGQSLTVVMATERAPAGTSQAWKITFQRIAAYRMRPLATAGQARSDLPAIQSHSARQQRCWTQQYGKSCNRSGLLT